MVLRFAAASLAAVLLSAPGCGVQPSSDQALETLIDDAFQRGALHGVVVIIRTDQPDLVATHGRASEPDGPPITADTRFRIASLTKVFTRLALLRLAEQGLLDLDDTLAQHRPNLDAPWAQSISLRQMIEFRSGLPRERAGGANPIETGVVYDEDGRALDFLDALTDDGPSVEIGTRTLYSNLGYMHLGAVIEQVTGTDIETAFQTLVFVPVGMTSTGIFGADTLDGETHAAGHARAEGGGYQIVADVPISVRYTAGGFYSTATDLSRLSHALLDGRLLNDDSLAILLTTEDDAPSRRFRVAGLVPGFANVWVISEEPPYAVISLNNAVGTPEDVIDVTDQICATIDSNAASDDSNSADDAALKREGWTLIPDLEAIPAHALRDAALTYLEVFETGDQHALYDAGLRVRGISSPVTDEDDRAQYEWFARYQTEIGKRRGPFSPHAWRLGENNALEVYMRGPQETALVFRFRVSSRDDGLVGSLSMATIGFEPDADLFEDGGPTRR